MKHKGAIWHDRKRNWLGLPWSFTVYEISDNRIFIDTGFFTQRSDEVRLYRVTDVVLTRSLWQRITGTGTIHIDSADVNMGNFHIKNIKKSVEIKEMLSEMVDEARRKNRVYARETMIDHPNHEDNQFEDDCDHTYHDPEDDPDY